MSREDRERLLLTPEEIGKLKVTYSKYDTAEILFDKTILAGCQAQHKKDMEYLDKVLNPEWKDKPVANMSIPWFFIGGVWESPSQLVEVEWLCIPSAGGGGCYLIAFKAANGRWQDVPERKYVSYSDMEGRWSKAIIPEVKER